MFDCKNITLLPTYNGNNIEQYVELLEKLFVFKNNYWKDKIATYEKESCIYHFYIRIDNLEAISNYSKGQNLIVEARTEVWDRDDNDGTDFLLILKIE